MKRKTSLLLVAVWMLFNSLGCPDDGKPADKIDQEAYIVRRYAALTTEYTWYYCMLHEPRRIYVGGKVNEGATGGKVSLYHYSYSQGYSLLSEFTLTNTENSYLRLNNNGDGDYRRYTAPLDFYYNDDAAWAYRVQTSDGVEVPLGTVPIASRNYLLERSFAPGYDVYDSGDDASAAVATAFDFASTNLITTFYRSDLDPIIILNVDSGGDDLDEWAIRNMSGDIYHSANVGSLFSVQNVQVVDGTGAPHADPVAWASAVGVTRYSSTGSTHDVGWSILMWDRINNTTLTGNDRRKEFNRVIIHELGHQRGITQGLHTWGHNGSRKGTCVMYLPSDLTQADRLEMLRKGLFCEGDIQSLLNIYW